MNKLKLPTSLGHPIKLDEAQGMITQYTTLRSGVEIKPTELFERTATPDQIEKTNVFVEMSKDYNAFVFTKDLIMRFFDGSLSDDTGNPQASNYLLVILGAHKEEKVMDGQTFKAGSFTVLTAGCTRRDELADDGTTVTKFYPLETPEPANEYPPTTTVTLEAGTELKWTGQHIDFFKVV